MSNCEEGLGDGEPPEVIILHMVVNNATLSLLNTGKGNAGLWKGPLCKFKQKQVFLNAHI